MRPPKEQIPVRNARFGVTAYLYVYGAPSVFQLATGSVASDPRADTFLAGDGDSTSIGISHEFFDSPVAQASQGQCGQLLGP